MAEYDIAVFVGRQQPTHNVHIELMDHCNKIANHTLVLLGSADCARTIKNPFHEEERIAMLSNHYYKEFYTQNKMYTDCLVDYPYNDSLWISQVQSAVDKLADELYPNKSPKIAFVANYKDMNSYWINFFPHWSHVKTYINKDFLNATDIRTAYFEQRLSDVYKNIPEAVQNYLCNFNTDIHEKLMEEYEWTKKYKESWSNAPYKPTFYTTDAVVIKSGHILLVERKFAPGKGLWALPGGYVNQEEKTFDSCIRELREETGIKTSKEELKNSLSTDKVFDYPDRSLRGRVITWAFNFNLGGGELPKVKGGDDAKKAFWIPINQVSKNSRMFFEDHKHIIEHFIYKQ